jgi:hypothetical protein
MSKNIKINSRVSWKTKSSTGKGERDGIVRAFVAAGKKIPKLPKGSKFKSLLVNKIHDRYLVEVEGATLASLWMAPKAATLTSG